MMIMAPLRLAAIFMNLEKYSQLSAWRRRIALDISQSLSRHLAHFPAPVAAAVVKTLAESASVPVLALIAKMVLIEAFRTGFQRMILLLFPWRKHCANQNVVRMPPAHALVNWAAANTPHCRQAWPERVTQPTDVNRLSYERHCLLAVSARHAPGDFSVRVPLWRTLAYWPAVRRSVASGPKLPKNQHAVACILGWKSLTHHHMLSGWLMTRFAGTLQKKRYTIFTGDALSAKTFISSRRFCTV